MSAALAVDLGPLFRTAPAWSRTNGDIAAGVGADLGFDLDVDQRWSLDAIFAEDDEGLPAASEYCVVGPRQITGKSAALEVAAITDVFVLGYPLHVWTAHQFKTSRKSYLDMRSRLKRHPDYASRVVFRDSHGEEAIIFDGGPDEGGGAIEFYARSGSSGRGFTTGRITMDEAMYVQPGDLGALVPTLVTIQDAQVRFAASAGMPASASLRSLRDRGRAGGDTSLAYIEHGAPVTPCEQGEFCSHELEDPGCALNDERLWLHAGPGLRSGRVTMKSMRRQRQMLSGAPREFSREFLSWWEDPAGGVGSAIDPDAWMALKTTDVERGPRPAFGVATAPDRSWSAIAVAFKRPDGAVHVALTAKDGRPDYRPGAAWVAGRVDELRGKWAGEVVTNTAAKGLVRDAVEPAEGAQAQAHNALADAVEAGTLRHGNQPAMNTAVRESRWKTSGNTRVLDQKGSADISPIVAAALALAALAGADDPSAYEERGLVVL